MLLVADNVINTYNYSNLLTAICKHGPVFGVQTLFFDKAAGRARKIGCLGTRLRGHQKRNHLYPLRADLESL